MHLQAVILAVSLLELATHSFASPLTAQQNMRTFPRPFYLETRNQDVSGGEAFYNYLDLTQLSNKQGKLIPKANAVAGDGSLFRLRNGVLSTEFSYTNGDGKTVTSKWKNTPLHGNHTMEFKPVSLSAHPHRHGPIHYLVGTNIFLSPGGNYSVSDWRMCHNTDDGSDYGLAVGDVHAEGIHCNPVYVYINPPNN